MNRDEIDFYFMEIFLHKKFYISLDFSESKGKDGKFRRCRRKLPNINILFLRKVLFYNWTENFVIFCSFKGNDLKNFLPVWKVLFLTSNLRNTNVFMFC